ncbi:hypothetical protein C4D60_Mb05t16080 [Musa balbisiana]|uniref:Uncharacterized protein n=1 Tax=Musa balbisiana TaxID=52838 RepID=A0A4S8JWI6_MUSBA|nr:hypothetical protein C4D60_Mb05t16080 [Musa balbisiana]
MQMSALSFHFMESADFFEIGGGVRGLSIDAVEKTSEDNVDAAGDKICCSVCPQVDSAAGRKRLPNWRNGEEVAQLSAYVPFAMH